MKKLFFLFVLISSSVIFAQVPNGMVQEDHNENRFAASFTEADQSFASLYNGEFRKKVKKASAEAVAETDARLDSVKNKYSAAAQEATRLTNEEYATQIAAFHQELEKDLGNIRQIYLPVMVKKDPVPQTNHPVLDKLVDNFFDGAKFAQADYYEKREKLQKVVYVERDPYFLGEVSKDETTIYLNSELLKYENLNWLIFHRQMGKLYGMKEKKRGHEIMARHWELDQDHENIAKNRRSRPHERKAFFDALAEENPLKKKI